MLSTITVAPNTRLTPLDAATGSGASLVPDSASPRSCTECGEVLSDKRIKAQPHATMCVMCLENRGDVVKTKRFDQNVGTLENPDVVSTYYRTPNQYLKQVLSNGPYQQLRIQKIPTSAAFPLPPRQSYEHRN